MADLPTGTCRVSTHSMRGCLGRLLDLRLSTTVRADVLALVPQVPTWKSNLVAMRERQVVRAFQS